MKMANTTKSFHKILHLRCLTGFWIQLLNSLSILFTETQLVNFYIYNFFSKLSLPK